MTVRLELEPLKHPSECDVCGGWKSVAVATVSPTGGGTNRKLWRWLPANLAVVIDCPQCTGAEELLAHLPRKPGAAGGVA
jgi:hypothetical protein